MISNTAPNVIDIVLLGGGHSHALLLRRWAMDPLPGVRLTLISQDVLTPYSGMLPGFIAGHYSSEEIHIDLSRLCRWAGVRFIEATITGLELNQNQVLLHDRPSIEYDVLSIDTGSTPNTRAVPGASEYTIPVKPISQLQNRWSDFCRRIEGAPPIDSAQLNIAVVGSGVGGFELLLALDYALQSLAKHYQMHWILRSNSPIKNRPGKAQQLALQACANKGIKVHTGFDVEAVKASGLLARDQRFLAVDEVFWCTAAAASEWPAAAGLAIDNRGFIAVNAHLQSLSHENVFASGDVATQIETPAAKAGVFAVRQAPILFQNLRRFVLKKSLKVYRPQRNTLSLMATGEKSAIATRGRMTLAGDWVWRWKDYIDRQFMNKFSELPERRMSRKSKELPKQLGFAVDSDTRRCGGCGAKVPASVLKHVLEQIETTSRKDVTQGLDALSDVAIIKGSGQAMAQSVDQFRAMLDDPYIFGRIAALHAMSDLFAAGASAQSAMALVAMPYASEVLLKRDLKQLMSGSVYEFNRHGCALTGGHTSEAAELSLGFAVNGWLPSPPAASRKMQVGDQLILTKALGTGIVLSADMHGRARGTILRETIRSMLISNAPAVPILQSHACAITDVTGFGLLGHLLNLQLDQKATYRLHLENIPTLPAAVELAGAGEKSTLTRSNKSFLSATDTGENLPLGQQTLLCDPQTSGGLLAVVANDAATECCRLLEQAGYDDASIIGEVTATDAPSVRVNLVGQFV